MEKTLQSQYNLIKEGKGDKAYFLKSAYRLFPDMLSPVNTFEDTVKILKNRSIISEGIGGIATSGKKQDWMSIFNENMNALTEAKEKEEPSKEVLDNQKHNFDYKDEKNYDNIFGEQFLKGYYTELKDPKNADKDVEELRAIVAKNLAKDFSYYVKDGQFGTKGIGYTTEAPGLGEPKEPKGKFKSSGYGDLKESILRLAIQDLIKEVLNEEDKMPPLKKGDKGIFDGEEVEIIATPMWAKPLPSDPSTPQPFTYDIKTKSGKIIKDLPINSVKPLNETLDMNAIKEEAENVKKKVMAKRIMNEIAKRKKQIKALETLTELEEDNEYNTKKVKELQSEIKKLENAKNKLHKVKEAGTYAGKKAVDDMKKDPDYSTLNAQAKADSEKKLQSGGSVTVGENKKK
jgi:hypothetical protein